MAKICRGKGQTRNSRFRLPILTMPAYLYYNVGMRTDDHIQYTIRNIPEELDKLLRKKAKEEDKSLNRIVIESLEKVLEVKETPVFYNDLDDLAGTWVSDPEFDKVIEAMDTIDPELWK